MKKRILCILCVILIFAMGSVCGEELRDAGLDLAGSSVHYPAVPGNEEISKRIAEEGNISEYLNRMSVLASVDNKVKVTWEGQTLAGIVSLVFHRTGALLTPNVHDEYSSVNLRSGTGEKVTLQDILTDEETSLLLTFIQENVEPEMSPHCPVCDMSTLPKDFRLIPGGLVLYYPMKQVTTLSERPGKVKVTFSEFLPKDYVPGENSLLPSLGFGSELTEEMCKSLLHDVSEGKLREIPVALGENAAEVLEKYPLAEDADLIADGRILTLDDGEFREVQLVTDRLTETFTSSVISGIRISAGYISGLVPGITSREQVKTAMGEPDSTVAVPDEAAEMNRMAPGISDYYVSGENRIRLHYNDEGLLSIIWLMK